MKLSVLSIACIAALAAASTSYASGLRPGSETVTAPTGKGFSEQRAPSTEIEAMEARLNSLTGGAKAGGSNSTQDNGKGGGELFNSPGGQAGSGGKTAPIAYHGGPIMLGNNTVYFIWYGNWSGNTATSILPNLISGENGSPYFNINTTYYNGSGTHISNSLTMGATTTDNYSQGTALSDAQVQQIVSDAITSGRLPSNTSASYMVLTSSDVNETSGFCTQYCGWHNHATIGGADIKYAFVGNPDRCPSACEAQTTGPNGNAGADGMASIIAHELEETVTDPDLNAWYDRQGAENADKCAWTFGTESTASNGAKYNVQFANGYKFLIQQNWIATGGPCAMSY